MSSSETEILYRSWSSTSAGGLQCGKLQQDRTFGGLSDKDLLDVFQQHIQWWNKTSTAIVSTISNFLRAVHIAYRKAHYEKDPDEVTLAFLAKRNSSSTKIHRARDRAQNLTDDEEELEKYKNEYLFEWEIPDSHIIHGVTPGVLYRRELDLAACIPAMKGVPDLNDFRRYVAQEKTPGDHFKGGYLCGIAACDFWDESTSKRTGYTIVQIECEG